MAEVSVIIPAYNEAGAVGKTVRAVRSCLESSGHVHEIIVVNDGSSDATGREAEEAGARVISHPINVGYGNSILTGVREAKYPLIALTDADGSYPVEEIPSMVTETARRGLHMLVAARQGKHFHGPLPKRLARVAFKFLAEFVVGQRIPDINSGLRVMSTEMTRELAPFLCGGFSLTTTLTMIAMLTSRFVDYRKVPYHERHGKSKVRYARDTLRTAQILIMTILLFNPIKLYILASGLVLLSGVTAAIFWMLIPVLRAVIGLFSAFGLTAAILLGLGFLAEQRRASIGLRPPGNWKSTQTDEADASQVDPRQISESNKAITPGE